MPLTHPAPEIVRTAAAGAAQATLVLVHGAWHGAWCWQDGFAQRLAARGITSVAPSLPAHAGSASSRRLNRLRMRDYVDAVLAVVAEETTRASGPVFLAGHSMGGAITQQLLARTDRPALAGAALLAAMPPKGVISVTLGLARHETGTFLAANATLDLGRLVRTPEQIRERFFRPGTSASVVEACRARVQSESYLAFLDMLALDRPKPRPVSEPILVVGAGEDTIFGADDVAATAAAWGTAPVMLPDLGHDLMLDDGWERTADLLADWVLTHA
ncbi:alpha/beta hydrolase [Nocardioides sp.]|uniref:alpha/beta hydrolase n=1 Tax=Nocardioides sp. TaxID=35761 RepID=UPI00351720F4